MNARQVIDGYLSNSSSKTSHDQTSQTSNQLILPPPSDNIAVRSIISKENVLCASFIGRGFSLTFLLPISAAAVSLILWSIYQHCAWESITVWVGGLRFFWNDRLSTPLLASLKENKIKLKHFRCIWLSKSPEEGNCLPFYPGLYACTGRFFLLLLAWLVEIVGRSVSVCVL